MIEPCLINNKTAPDMSQFFPTESVNKMPPFVVCPSTKLDTYNQKIFQRNETFRFNINGIEGCDEPFNMQNYGNLQQEFAKNIDVDSELKRINYYDDKCYQDNYKVKPDQGRLKCHAKFLKKDYHQNEQGRTFEGQHGRVRHSFERGDVLYPDKAVVTGGLGSISEYPEPNCVASPESFQVCPYEAPHQNPNTPVYYNFNNEEYIRHYPCQRLFHNMTKRKMIPTWNQRYDINPDCLALF